MTFAELSRLFAEEGDFSLVDSPEGFLEITLTIDGLYTNKRCYRWDEVARWGKAAVVYESMRLYAELDSYIRREHGADLEFGAVFHKTSKTFDTLIVEEED